MLFKSSRTVEKTMPPLMLNTAPDTGIYAGTLVGTPDRWAHIEDLRVGDEVLTAENGTQEITGIERGVLSVESAKAAHGQWPLLIPEGALRNERAIIVSPSTRLVIEDHNAAMLFGQSCVSVKAEALIGFKGVARARLSEPLTHVSLVFDDPQTLVGQGGVFFEAPDLNGVLRFPPLNERQSRLLIRQMSEHDRKRRARKMDPAWI